MYRQAKARPAAWWHEEQAMKALKVGNWFAAAFHSGILLNLTPGSRISYDQLHSSVTQLDEETRALLPQMVRDSLLLPKPPLTLADADRINHSVWQRVSLPSSNADEKAVEQMEEVCRDHPSGMYFNTLGLTLYRAGKYTRAITACEQSVKKTPDELRLDSPYPGDLAILAMSHFQLDNQEAANKYRDQLTEIMEFGSLKDDEECISFMKEVGELLEPQIEASSKGDEESIPLVD